MRGALSNNIVEVGLRGSGKSAVGRQLAELTARELFETDEMVVSAMSMSIPEAVKAEGWDYFRDQETKVLTNLATVANAIISTGGGMVERPLNRKFIRDLGSVFWLQAPPEVLAARIGNDPNRPPLTDETDLVSELTIVSQRRNPMYIDVMDFQIDTEKNDTLQAAQLILRLTEPPAA